jgi:NADH dehydrogenase (ubiquinone) Fe-S protein 3
MLSLNYIQYIKKCFPIQNVKLMDNDIIFVVKEIDILNILYFLKVNNNCLFNCLTAISGVDYLERFNRFEIVYEVLSLSYNRRLRIKVFVDSNSSIQSICSLYKAANWWEREIWDMFGVFFKSHPDLRRILTDYGFKGHPLRKDFPLSGYIEVFYDEKLKRVVSYDIELPQEFRYFEFKSPWSPFFYQNKKVL